jgi:hypothetical protein
MSTQPKAKSTLSRRYVVGAVVVAIVGFFGQLVADFSYLSPSPNAVHLRVLPFPVPANDSDDFRRISAPTFVE